MLSSMFDSRASHPWGMGGMRHPHFYNQMISYPPLFPEVIYCSVPLNGRRVGLTYFLLQDKRLLSVATAPNKQSLNKLILQNLFLNRALPSSPIHTHHRLYNRHTHRYSSSLSPRSLLLIQPHARIRTGGVHLR